MEKHVDTNAHISTGEFPVYTNLSKRGFVNYGVVKHVIEEYRRDEISTNTVERFFSQLKRMIVGTHLHVSKQHL
ncbi:hypothetical protein EON73_01805 [bacterium]|nr:MAG: hypothetical protein EON73_01805 [bacterium]